MTDNMVCQSRKKALSYALQGVIKQPLYQNWAKTYLTVNKFEKALRCVRCLTLGISPEVNTSLTRYG